MCLRTNTESIRSGTEENLDSAVVQTILTRLNVRLRETNALVYFSSPSRLHPPHPSLSLHHHKTSQTSWWYSNAVQKHSLLLTYAFMPDITTCTRCIKVLSHLLFQRHLKDATRKRSRQTDRSLLDKKELLYNQSVIAMFIFSIFFCASETLHHKAMSICWRDIYIM